jgi:PadR family transcriptional regulator PadR
LAYMQQLLKGLIDPIVLSTISRLPIYGYQIIKELERRTEGRLRLKAGTVYPSLRRLEKNGLIVSGWIQATKQRGRKYYHITEKGRQFLVNRSVEWQDFCMLVNSLIRESTSDDSRILPMS